MKDSIRKTLNGSSLLKGKIAIITGAAAGIGRACAQIFSSQGAKLLLVNIDKDNVSKVQCEIRASGGEAISVWADVTMSKDVDKVFSKLERLYDRLDILINNAGGGLPSDFSNISRKQWDRVLNLNLTSTFLMSQKAIKYLRKSNSAAIVNISSIAGRSVSLSAGCHYTSSKAGILGLTRHMASIFAKDGLRINAVCPGATNSERIMHRLGTKNKQQKLINSIPLGRIGDVDEIASSILFLASDLSSYITGAVLDVNGGIFMG